VTDAGYRAVKATTRSEDALGCDTLFYSGEADEANALLVEVGGLSGVGVVRQREIQSMGTEKDRDTLIRLAEEWPK